MAEEIKQKNKQASDSKLLATESQAVVKRSGFGADIKTGDFSVTNLIFTIMAYVIAVVTFPFSMYYIFLIVKENESLVIYRNGLVHKSHGQGPGFVHYLKCIDSIIFVDLRIKHNSIPRQDVLTSDFLSVSVEAAVFYRVVNPVKALTNVQNFKSSTQLLAAATLRNSIGGKTLKEVLSNRTALAAEVSELMKRATHEWGIHIYNVEMKDISLPPDLQRAMAAESETLRLANAKVLVTKAEIRATKSLDKACTILSDNTFALQLRYLQSLQSIAGEKCHTVLVPISIETYKKIFRK